MRDVELQTGTEDKHVFRLAANGTYSAKSVYGCFFLGSVQFGPARGYGRLGLQLNVIFFLWLAALRKCWTADWLRERHGTVKVHKAHIFSSAYIYATVPEGSLSRLIEVSDMVRAG
jgi:hypothetical protein